MADDLTPEQRHKNMQAIKSKDMTIELTLRKALWSKGIRYRKNCKALIGKPDIAIIKSLFSAIRNTGTVMIGKTETRGSSQTESIGFQRSNATWHAIKK